MPSSPQDLFTNCFSLFHHQNPSLRESRGVCFTLFTSCCILFYPPVEFIYGPPPQCGENGRAPGSPGSRSHSTADQERPSDVGLAGNPSQFEPWSESARYGRPFNSAESKCRTTSFVFMSYACESGLQASPTWLRLGRKRPRKPRLRLRQLPHTKSAGKYSA